MEGEEVIAQLKEWKEEFCEDECKTSDGIEVFGFDEGDWQILLHQFAKTGENE